LLEKGIAIMSNAKDQMTINCKMDIWSDWWLKNVGSMYILLNWFSFNVSVQVYFKAHAQMGALSLPDG